MSDVNRKIAELRGWVDIYEEEWFEDYSNLFGTFPGAVRPMPLPDYAHSLDESIKAAGELLNYNVHIYLDPDNPHIVYKNGKRNETGDLWSTLPAQSNDPTDIAAAICAAILQAHGVTVSEVSE